MRNERTVAGPAIRWMLAAALLLGMPLGARAQSGDAKATFDVYGFAMLDAGYDFKQNDPAWFDVMRPTKLPSYENEFGKDGRAYFGVRQSRLGVRSTVPTAAGEIKTIFEFELFGTGGDAGQTTFRLRHAWGEMGQFGFGQTWSPFMDPDVFPNSIEYWGPNGMVFFRNVQARWMPMKGANALTIALERPGASGDQGEYAGRVELEDVVGRFPLPDVSAQYRVTQDWGHLQVAGIVRPLVWDDLAANTPGHDYDLSDSTIGWGVNVSTNVNIAKDVVRASVVYGAGIQNYMNDAPVDVAVDKLVTDPADVKGKALPVLGIVLFYDRTWNDLFSSTIGYSRVDITNSDGQSDSAYKTGQYALVNLMYYPVKGVMMGPEVQWARRQNNADGWSVDDYRIQFSAKYSFGKKFGGEP
jgi:hypothetical protein